ncbi:MAG: DUF4058 family protein [Chloroflexi bacterium]|nr:DUF4058 family protein [Chloroflexota bacterium]
MTLQKYRQKLLRFGVEKIKKLFSFQQTINWKGTRALFDHKADIPEQVKLRAVHVYETETKELVTIIEVLSPYNKRGTGLEEYREKCRHILHTQVHSSTAVWWSEQQHQAKS